MMSPSAQSQELGRFFKGTLLTCLSSLVLTGHLEGQVLKKISAIPLEMLSETLLSFAGYQLF